MKANEEEFQKYEECLTKDVALQGYFFYQLAGWLADVAVFPGNNLKLSVPV